MKITIGGNNESMSHTISDGATVAKVLQVFVGVLIAYGFHPSRINQYFVDEESPLEWNTE